MTVSPHGAGGGERYLFSIIKSLQDQGHHVDLITDDYNVCRTKEEALQVAQALRVFISPSKLTYVMVKHFRETLPMLPWKYKVFFSLGNGKVSRSDDYRTLGSMYLCSNQICPLRLDIDTRASRIRRV